MNDRLPSVAFIKNITFFWKRLYNVPEFGLDVPKSIFTYSKM